MKSAKEGTQKKHQTAKIMAACFTENTTLREFVKFLAQANYLAMINGDKEDRTTVEKLLLNLGCFCSDLIATKAEKGIIDAVSENIFNIFQGGEDYLRESVATLMNFFTMEFAKGSYNLDDSVKQMQAIITLMKLVEIYSENSEYLMQEAA